MTHTSFTVFLHRPFLLLYFFHLIAEMEGIFFPSCLCVPLFLTLPQRQPLLPVLCNAYEPVVPLPLGPGRTGELHGLMLLFSPPLPLLSLPPSPPLRLSADTRGEEDGGHSPSLRPHGEEREAQGTGLGEDRRQQDGGRRARRDQGRTPRHPRDGRFPCCDAGESMGKDK